MNNNGTFTELFGRNQGNEIGKQNRRLVTAKTNNERFNSEIRHQVD